MDMLQSFWITAQATPTWLLTIYAFFTGAVLASFGGLVAHRLPYQIGWVDTDEDTAGYTINSPRSHCDTCKKTLPLYALIPILGWMFTLGRCASCKARVSPWYPLSECLLGAIFALGVLWADSLAHGVAIMILSWSALVITQTDLEHHLIPELLTIPLFWAGLLLSPFEPEAFQRVLGAFVAGSLVLGSFLIVGRMKSVDAVSGGDVAFLTMAGAWLGMDGVLNYAILGCLIFIIHAKYSKFRTGDEWTPMAPALSLALVVFAFFPDLSLIY